MPSNVAKSGLTKNIGKDVSSPNAAVSKKVGETVQSFGNPTAKDANQEAKSPEDGESKNSADKPKSERPEAPVPNQPSQKPESSKISPKGPEDAMSTEKDRRSAKKKLNMNRLMVTKVYDLKNCQCTDQDLNSMTLGGLAIGAEGQLDQNAVITRGKNADPNAITDLHVKHLPTLTSAVLLADESTPAQGSSATPRTKEAELKRLEARKKALQALKKILDNKNLRSLAREGRQRRGALADALGCNCQHADPCQLSGTRVAPPIEDPAADAHACCSRAARELACPPARIRGPDEEEDLDDVRSTPGINVTVSKQNNEFSNEILISIKSPRQDNLVKASPAARKGRSRLAEPPDIKKRRSRLDNHISTVKLKEREHPRDDPRGRSNPNRDPKRGHSQTGPSETQSQVHGEFKVRSNSAGLDLVQTSPLFIPWRAIDGGPEARNSGSFEHSSYCVNRKPDDEARSELGRCQDMFPHVPQKLNSRRRSLKKPARHGDSVTSQDLRQGRPFPSQEKTHHTDGKVCDFREKADCEICRHLMHYEYHVSLGDCRVAKSPKERSLPKTQLQTKSQKDRRSQRSPRGRRSMARRKEGSSKDRASSRSRSKREKQSSPGCMKPPDRKDKKSSKAKQSASKKSHQERKRYVKALEKFISFKPQAVQSKGVQKKKPPSRRHGNSSAGSGGSDKRAAKKSAKSHTEAKKNGRRHSNARTRTQSEPSEINHHEPLLSSQGRRRVPKSGKASREKSRRDAKRSPKEKPPRVPQKQPKNISNLIKGGAARRVSRFSFPADASAGETATPSSIVNYAIGNVAGPVLGFDESSDPDMPVLKGGSEMPRTKSSWNNLMRVQRSASPRSLKRPINSQLNEKLNEELGKKKKKKKKKKSRKSLFRSKLSGMLNVFSRYGGHRRRKEPTKITVEKESKTELPGFEASRTTSHIRLSEEGGDRARGWLNWHSLRDGGFTNDEKTYGWENDDSGGKKEARRKIKPPLSENNSSLVDMTSDRWEDWTSSSSCKSNHARRRR